MFHSSKALGIFTSDVGNPKHVWNVFDDVTCTGEKRAEKNNTIIKLEIFIRFSIVFAFTKRPGYGL